MLLLGRVEHLCESASSDTRVFSSSDIATGIAGRFDGNFNNTGVPLGVGQASYFKHSTK